jgi:hypothetical protein
MEDHPSGSSQNSRWAFSESRVRLAARLYAADNRLPQLGVGAEISEASLNRHFPERQQTAT